jgi:SanA protein
MPMKTLKSLGFLCLLGVVSIWIINAYIQVVAKRLTIPDLDQLPDVEAVVVPGASVYRSGKLSPILQQRMNAALRVLAAKPSAKLLVSGHAIKGGYSETRAMIDYARRNGIEDARILQDDGGRSTYVTMLHCRREFQLKSLVLVSQPFHLARGLYVGSRLGLTVYGFPAAESTEDDNQPFREYLTRFKDFILLKVSRGFNAY